MRKSNRQTGFTLIETLVCVLIITLMAGVAARSLNGARSRVDFDVVVQRLTEYDRFARMCAQCDSQAVRLVYHATSIEQQSGNTNVPDQTVGRMACHLPPGYTIDRMRHATSGLDALPTNIEGDQEVLISPAGRSRSYLFRLTGPYNQQMWMVVCGLTGQGLTLDDETQSDKLYALLNKARLDAD